MISILAVRRGSMVARLVDEQEGALGECDVGEVHEGECRDEHSVDESLRRRSLSEHRLETVTAAPLGQRTLPGDHRVARARPCMQARPYIDFAGG